MFNCRRHGPGGGAACAFTLIELMLVVVIVALLASVAINRTASAITNSRVRMAAERVSADLALARERAISAGVTHKVLFEKASYESGTLAAFESGQVGPPVDLSAEPYLLDQVEVDFDGGTAVTFDPYGTTSAGGVVKLTAGGVQRCVLLDSASGRATVE